jgi:ABC-type transport system involved in multi-copper enzyme maturation permease subunit
MVGPLFYHEMLLGSRRSRDYVFRWVYVGWLLVQLCWFAFIDSFLYSFFSTPPSQHYTAYVSRHFAEVFIPQHFILLALVTPAFVASAITEEKTRGTLQYLLTTDLAPIHIIVGKLIGRIIQVCVLALAGLPFFAILGAFGGVEPALFLGLLVMTVLVAAGVASATFLAAVWCRQTRDAVIALYAVGVIVAPLVLSVGGPLESFNPVAVLEPAFESGGWEAVRLLGRHLFLGLLAWGGLTVACLALAAWRLRPAYIKQLQGEGRPNKRRWWLPRRAPVGERPVMWKERHVEGLAPVPWLRFVPRWLGICLTVAATVAGSCFILVLNRNAGVTPEDMLGMALRLHFLDLAGAVDWAGAGGGFLAQGSLAMNVFALLVAVRCSGAVTGERERQTWEALLLTPLTVEQLIRGKLWGIMLVSYIYLAAYAVPALLLSVLGGPISVFWTGLNLAVTLLAMYYLGAVGLWSSVRAKTSWRSLLITVLVAYLAGLAFNAVLFPAVLIISLLIYAVLSIAASYFGVNAGGLMASFGTFSTALLIACWIGMVVAFYIAARLFLRGAQKWVADRERTRHWEDDPIQRPRKRRRRIVREHQGGL